MGTPANKISEIALKWKSIDPGLYEHFLRLMDAYVDEVTVAVTEAPAADILQAQGRAQNARMFLRIFTEVLEQPTPR